MDPHDFCQEVRTLIPEMMQESGCVLFSSCRTLQPGSIYIMGFNPGGPDRLGTIEADLTRLEQARDDWSAYVDDDWGRRSGRKIQKSIRWIVKELDLNIRDVCASNLIFRRSASSRHLSYRSLADRCWPVHERILRLVQPRKLLVYGIDATRSPFAYLKRRAESEGSFDVASEPEIDSYHGDWKCRAFRMTIEGKKLVVVGVPHVSWYKLEGKTAVAEWVKRVN